MKNITLILTDDRVWNVEVEESFTVEDDSQFVEVVKDGQVVLLNKNNILAVRGKDSVA